MKANLCRVGGLLAALLISASVYAGDIQAENGWVRASAPGQDAASVDMTLTSQQAAALVGVSSPACKTVELHHMTTEGGMMKMREVSSIDLPAGKAVNLGESGYHLMMVGLKAPLKAGETVPLTLSLKVGGQANVKVETTAEVKPLNATKASSQHDEHMHMDMYCVSVGYLAKAGGAGRLIFFQSRK
jgi:copper(I)-binding protein